MHDVARGKGEEGGEQQRWKKGEGETFKITQVSRVSTDNHRV